MDFGDCECWRLRGQEGCREKEQRMKGSEAEQEERGGGGGGGCCAVDGVTANSSNVQYRRVFSF